MVHVKDQTLKIKLIRRLPLVAGLSVVLMAVIIGSWGDWFQGWDTVVWDIMQRMPDASHKPDPRIVLAAIDQRGMEAFIREGVPYPWPRDIWAYFVSLADSAGALGVGFDVLFDTPGLDLANSSGYDTDMAFAAQLGGEFPVVIAASVSVDGSESEIPPKGLRWSKHLPNKSYNLGADHLDLPHPRFQHSLMGVTNISAESDGVIRRAPTLIRLKDDLAPSLSLAIAGQLSESAIDYARLDDQGEIWLRYYGAPGPGGPFPYISVYDLVTGRLSPEVVKGKILLVGGYSAGLLDYKPTPVSSAAHPFPGFEIHATTLSHLLKGDGLRPLKNPLKPLQILFFGILGLMAVDLNRRMWLQIALLGATMGAALVFVFICFRSGFLAGMTAPILAQAAGAGAMLFVGWNQEGKQRRRLYNVFTRYLDRRYVERIMVHADEVETDGDLKDVAILFSDLVGFTSCSESLTPRETVSLLNDYYDGIVGIYFEYGGLIDKYIGDSVMVLFGAPLALPETFHRSALAILEAQKRVEEISSRRQLAGLPTLGMRTGIHCAEVVIGSIGHPDRKDFTAIGAGVNTASRLEGLTRQVGSLNLVSEEFLVKLPDSIVRREIGRFLPKGIGAPIKVFELLPDEAGGNWLSKWEEGWRQWAANQRLKALGIWRAIQEERPEDQALSFLIARLEEFTHSRGEEDDVMRMEKKK